MRGEGVGLVVDVGADHRAERLWCERGEEVGCDLLLSVDVERIEQSIKKLLPTLSLLLLVAAVKGDAEQLGNLCRSEAVLHLLEHGHQRLKLLVGFVLNGVA